MMRIGELASLTGVAASTLRFYERNGFAYCPPFGDYALDPNSCFMTRAL